MRKLLFGLALLIGLAARSQTYTDVPGRWRYFFVKITEGFAPPQDTLSTAPTGSIAVKNGVMYVKGVSWIPISGGGGSGVWGSITGLIGNQTDLVNLLGAKMDSSKRTMDTLYAITDSTFGYYIHNQFRTFKALGAIKSFNGRNGAIILTQADVVTGLGYTPLAPTDTVGRWVSLITNNATNDSIIYYIGNTRYAIKDNGSGGGPAFDSATSQGGVFHTTPFNDARYTRNGGGAPQLIEDLLTNLPASSSTGSLYYATDAKILFRWNGVSWDVVAGLTKTVKTIANLYGYATVGLQDSSAMVVTDTIAGGLFIWRSTSTTADDSGTVIKPSAISGAGRWIRQYNSYKNVRFWGAKGDGTTNDTKPVQSAMNHSVGGTLFFPAGIYLADSLIYPAQLSIRGESRRNTRLQATASGAQSFIRLGPGQSNETYWEDLSIVANASNAGQNGFDFTAVPGTSTGGLWNFVMDRVDVTNFRGTSIYLFCQDGAFDMAHQFITLHQIRGYCTSDTTSHALQLVGQVNQVTVSDCEFDGPTPSVAGTKGIILKSLVGSNDQIVGAVSFQNVSVQGFELGTFGFNVQGTSFKDCYFESDSSGFWLTNGSRVTLENMHFSNVANNSGRYIVGNDNSVVDLLGYRLTPNPINGKLYTSPSGTSGGGIIRRGVGQTSNTVTTVFTGQNINVSANTLNTGYFADILTNVSSSRSNYCNTINSSLSPGEILTIRAYDATHTSNNPLLFKVGGNITLPGSLDSGFIALYDGQSVQFLRTDIGSSTWAMIPSSITPLYMNAFPTTGTWLTGTVIRNNNPTTGTAAFWVNKGGLNWDSVVVGNTGGGGTIGGSIASGQVAYGSASNTIAGDAHFTNNSSTHTVFSDSIHTSSLLADASALTTNQFPHRLLTGYGGYSGLLLKNMSTSGAGATQLKITTASEKGGFLFNVLGDNWPGANATPVLRIFGNQPFVQAADSADFIWEQGTPGVSAQEWMHYFYNPAYQNASLLIGNVLPFPADYRNHGSTLFVYGSAKVMSGLTLNDAGQHYYVIRGGNFHDSVNYQGGIGAEIRGAIVSQPDNPLLRLDSVGRARLYFYNNSNPAQAISTKALLVDNSGNVKLGGVYDTAAGTQNGTAVLYWGPNGYPTSNDSKLSFNYNTNVLDVRSTAGGMLKADSAALYHGYLRLADYGGTYAYVAADNYQLRTSYVEGVNLRFRVVNSTNPRLDAFEIDSTGDIRWLVQPKTYTTGDSVLMIASNGIVHKMRISDLGAIIGTGGGFYQTVQSNAVSQTQRAKLNFNSHFTVTDNSGNGSTDVDLTTAADQSAKDSSSKIANTKYVDKAVAAALASSPVNVYDLGSGGSQQRANAVGDSLYIRTSYTNGRADDTLADGGINHVTGNLFSQTADGTVTNTASTTSILGTGTGSKTIPIKYLVAGQTIRVKGFGYISTDASVPTLTITLNNGSSTAGNGVGGLLTASMNNVPIEWEYWGTVRTTGSSGTIMMNGWISIGGVKAYLASSAASLFDNTSGKTFDVTAQWGTASTNNTIVTKQCDISVN